MRKKILFICKHNIFRSKVAEAFFNRMNKNHNYYGESAGIFKWDYANTKDDKGFKAERKVAKEFGINLKGNSRSISSQLLKNTNIVVIAADNVPKELFEHEKKDKVFNGKIIVWKIKDVKERDVDKEAVALAAVKAIEKRTGELVKSLK